MVKRDNNIHITVISEGETYSLISYPNEYRSLMMLIYDRLSPEQFGDCLGMGKCGTCLVEIHGYIGQLSSYNRNEGTTIRKAGIDTNLRLACQILIDEHMDGSVVTVLRET